MNTVSLSDIKKLYHTLQTAERFFDSVVLFALFDPGIFVELADGPKSAAQLQSDVGGNEES